MKRVYIAGPYTVGDPVVNTARSVDVWHELWKAGIAGYVPHLSMFMHYLHPLTYEEWMAYDQAWLDACDGLLRLPGESPGADREVKRARELKLPIFKTMKSCIRNMKPKKGDRALTPGNVLELFGHGQREASGS